MRDSLKALNKLPNRQKYGRERRAPKAQRRKTRAPFHKGVDFWAPVAWRPRPAARLLPMGAFPPAPVKTAVRLGAKAPFCACGHLCPPLVIASCRKQTAWILRTFASRDIQTMRTLWISLVRPIIDYCSPLWSPKPTSYGQIDKLEGVLRSFSKNVDGLRELPYCDRLRSLSLHSIQRRHERYKILYMYKIKEGLVPNLPINPFNPETSFGLEFSSNPRTGCRCSIPEQILYHNPAEIPRNSSFALTATNLWNCLPPSLSLISNKSVDYFKKQLDKFLDIFPDEPRCSASGQYYDPNTGRTTNSIWHLQSDPSIKMEINAYSKRLKYAESMQGRASSR